MMFILKNRYQEEAGGEGGEAGGTGGEAGGTGGEGNEPSWRDGLSEEHQANPALADFADADALAGSYLSTKAMVGNSIRIPGEDASDEDRTTFSTKLMESSPNLMMKPDFDNPEQNREFYRTLGMPENSSGYQLPEGVELPDDRKAFLTGMAHDIGLNQKQFNGVMAKINEQDNAILANQKQVVEDGMQGLKQEWGMAYDERHASAVAMAEKTGAPAQLVNAIKNNAVGADTIRWLHGLSENVGSEGRQMHDQGDANNVAIVPEEAQTKIDEIMNNRKHPYWIGSDPGHNAALKKMIELQKAAHPGASTDINQLRAGGMAG